MERLDAFYTCPSVAARCVAVLGQVLKGYRLDYFIEPSAGRGDFYDILPKARRLGLDVAPARSYIRTQDFLCWHPRDLPYPPEARVCIGNPPFGRRAQNAIAFFCHAAQLTHSIAFIVPIIFRKYLVHKQLPLEFQWIHSEALPAQSFYTANGRPYSVHAEFQLWTRLVTPYRNQRHFAPLPIRHPDFAMNQYNNTPQAEKYFGMPFDFAVPCQGWQNYQRRETQSIHCERSKQWMLLKAHSKSAYERLYNQIDYAALARKHTTAVPGFRKADLVQEYHQQFG